MTETLKIQAFTDEELLRKYLDEDNSLVLEQLFGRYIRFVFLVCMKYFRDEDKAKDASMQVFEKVIADIKRFDIQNFKSWLHVVSKNYCLMQLRSEKTNKTVRWENEKESTKIMENHPDLHHDSESEKENRLVQLEDAIGKLDEGQKQCIELFFIKEKSYKEVSDITGYSMNEVKSFIQNGKRNLKNLLIANGDVLLYVFAFLHLTK